MTKAIKQQLATLSMYEHAILMFCLQAYFTSGNYTNHLPLAEMLPDVAAIFDVNPQVNVFAKLTALKVGTAPVFTALTYDKAQRQLTTVLNKKADLQTLQQIVAH